MPHKENSGLFRANGVKVRHIDTVSDSMKYGKRCGWCISKEQTAPLYFDHLNLQFEVFFVYKPKKQYPSYVLLLNRNKPRTRESEDVYKDNSSIAVSVYRKGNEETSLAEVFYFLRDLEPWVSWRMSQLRLSKSPPSPLDFPADLDGSLGVETLIACELVRVSTVPPVVTNPHLFRTFHPDNGEGATLTLGVGGGEEFTIDASWSTDDLDDEDLAEMRGGGEGEGEGEDAYDLAQIESALEINLQDAVQHIIPTRIHDLNHSPSIRWMPPTPNLQTESRLSPRARDVQVDVESSPTSSVSDFFLRWNDVVNNRDPAQERIPAPTAIHFSANVTPTVRIISDTYKVALKRTVKLAVSDCYTGMWSAMISDTRCIGDRTTSLGELSDFIEPYLSPIKEFGLVDARIELEAGTISSYCVTLDVDESKSTYDDNPF